MRRYNPVMRLWRATGHSLSGLRTAFKEEQAFEYETVVFFLLVALSLSLSWGEALLLLASWLAVMAMELVNSAVERAFNLLDREWNAEVRAGKDMLSAAVFLLILCNVALWVFLAFRHRAVFFPWG
ncbi:MAG: diacylglycerol kinase [Fretibacterium sp.]|nr:diacylglycerol kinase [Fretibacterium sp.]